MARRRTGKRLSTINKRAAKDARIKALLRKMSLEEVAKECTLSLRTLQRWKANLDRDLDILTDSQRQAVLCQEILNAQKLLLAEPRIFNRRSGAHSRFVTKQRRVGHKEVKPTISPHEVTEPTYTRLNAKKGMMKKSERVRTKKFERISETNPVGNTKNAAFLSPDHKNRRII